MLAMVLVTLTLLSACVVFASAESFTPSEESVIYFEVPTDWANFQKVYCHILDSETQTSLANWQSKKELCTQVEGNLYSYDISKAGILTEGKTYEVIFHLDIGARTYETTFSTECFSDTLYCNDTVYENPYDSSKVLRGAFWKNQDSAVYGPAFRLTSLCNTIGTAIPKEHTKEDVLEFFIFNILSVAQRDSRKDDQEIIDDAMHALGLSPSQVRNVLTEASKGDCDFSVKWNGTYYGNTPANVPIEPDSEPLLYFEVPAAWQDYKYIYCHIWDWESSVPLLSWQSRKSRCTQVEENFYSYDISSVATLEKGKLYGVIFSDDTGRQTYDVMFSTDCFCDTLYWDGTVYEDVFGGDQDAYVSYWRDQDKLYYGPAFVKDSFGYVYGTAIPFDTTKEEVVGDILQNSWWSSQGFPYRSDQEILDDIMKALDLSKEDMERILLETPGYSPVIWNGKQYTGRPIWDVPSETPDESPSEPPMATPDEGAEEVLYGDANSDGDVNIKDATYIQKYCAGMVTELNRTASDVNVDGSVNIKDVTVIQKYLIDMYVGLPVISWSLA